MTPPLHFLFPTRVNIRMIESISLAEPAIAKMLQLSFCWLTTLFSTQCLVL